MQKGKGRIPDANDLLHVTCSLARLCASAAGAGDVLVRWLRSSRGFPWLQQSGSARQRRGDLCNEPRRQTNEYRCAAARGAAMFAQALQCVLAPHVGPPKSKHDPHRCVHAGVQLVSCP
jgi:hypothetical protein